MLPHNENSQNKSFENNQQNTELNKSNVQPQTISNSNEKENTTHHENHPKNENIRYPSDTTNNNHSIANASILTDENISQIPANASNLNKIAKPTKPINITHENNTQDHKKLKQKNVKVDKADNSFNNDRNKITSTEPDAIDDTNDSSPQNNYFRDFNGNKRENLNRRNKELNINNNQNKQKDNIRKDNSIYPSQETSPNEDGNNINDKDEDSLVINIDKKGIEYHYENIPDLDRGKELYILSGMKPLPTVLYLSIGPILSQITSAIESFIQTIWVSKAIGIEGMSAISSYMPFENISRAFGLTAACAGSNSISGMIATNKADKEEGSQVIADLLRVCLIIGIIIPAVLCPLVEKAVKWFGANENIVKLGYKYILPILICTFFTCMYLAITGFLEGEGRPILYTVITITTSLANIAFLCPLFLLGLKTGIVGAGLAQVLSHAISGIVLFVFYFTGAFTVKPKFKQLFKKFSPLTTTALKACLSQGIANLALCIPAILIRKLLGKLSISEDDYTNSVTGFHAVTRYTQFVDKIIIAFVTGYLPAASYAFSSQNYKRWLFLTLHVNWLCFAWGSFTAILTFTIPTQLAKAFLDNDNYVCIASTMIRIANCGGFFAFAEYTVGNMLRSLKMGFMAAVMGTLVHIVGIFGFSLLLYYTNKTRPEILMYAFPLSNLFGLVAAGLFIIYPAWKFYHEWKFDENREEKEIDNTAHPLPRVEVANVDAMI